MVDFSVLEKRLLAKGYTPELLAIFRESARSHQNVSKNPGPAVNSKAGNVPESTESTPASEESSLISSEALENREKEMARIDQITLLMKQKLAEKCAIIEKLNAQVLGSEGIESETEQVSFKVEKQRTEIQNITYGIDLALLMDCTGSMGPYIDMVRRKIADIIHCAKDIDPRAKVRIAFLGYRDIGSATRFIKVDFKTKEDIPMLVDTLSSVQAVDGGDAPEDIAGALNVALSLNWKSRTRLLVIIGDAPCHGSRYHSEVDEFPNGDPHGLVPEDLIIQLASESVDLVFGRITSFTDQMTGIFQKSLGECGRTMRIIDASSGPEVFLEELKQTMSSSFREAVRV